MKVIKKSQEVPYTPEQMYKLVNAIEAYPEFLPWCSTTTVHSRNDAEIQATIQVGKGGIQYSFTTLNRLQAHQRIEVRLIQGPFRHLQGYWQFEPIGAKACQVSLNLEFEFSSKLHDIASGPFLQKIAESFIEVFSLRAKNVYGE